MGRTVNRAAELRAAREAFELAMELGCTPRAAAHELRRRRLAALRACGRHADAARPPAEPDLSAPGAAGFSDWHSRWMMRD